MFQRILIANRGEIAVRIIKTCQRLGVSAAVVYSEADAASQAVEMADEAVPIGPAPAAESYLVIDKILDAVKRTGAEAVHPGFGFLSENADFARALADAGVAFVGPNPKAVEAMGDKIASKHLAAKAGVSTIPGHEGLVADAKTAKKAAEAIGFPVMIKASAGGGGKGMRIAHTMAEVEQGFESARNEARSAFGDDRILMERFVERPRHIEIQVLGDKHGTVLHLGERECSLQRRNQKVLEEAPSPYLDEATRAAMAGQAVELAQAVDYDSAGTVEFIVDPQKNFFFLEMNTRLQVEHPVTEMITGLDLVEQMMRVAAGEKLAMTQEDVRFDGWAVEARLYAEDPRRGFLPSIGRLKTYRPPAEGPLNGAQFRLDTGVVEGDRISLHYDPMIAKMIAYGADRITAIDGLAAALDHMRLEGLNANHDFLAAVLQQDAFRTGDLHTGYIAEHFPDGFAGGPLTDELRSLFAVFCAYATARDQERAQATARSKPSDPGPADAPHAWCVLMAGEDTQVDLTLRDGGAQARLGDRVVTLETHWRSGDRVATGLLNGLGFALTVTRTGVGYELARHGVRLEASAATPAAAALRAKLPVKDTAAGSAHVLSPMPGLVSSILAVEGQDVKAGEPLLVVEAMKMENVIHAHRDGVISAVCVAPGDSVAADAVLMEFGSA